MYSVQPSLMLINLINYNGTFLSMSNIIVGDISESATDFNANIIVTSTLYFG